MSTFSSADIEHALALSQDEMRSTTQRLTEAYSRFITVRKKEMSTLAMEVSRDILRPALWTSNLVEMALPREHIFPQECIRAAVEDQARLMEHAIDYARILSSQEHNQARAMAAQLAEASRQWQFNWKNVQVYLDVPRFAESLQTIQSEIEGLAHLAYNRNTVASTIAKAALGNVEAFQWVNSDALKRAVEGADHALAFAGLSAAADYVVQYNDFASLAVGRLDPPAIQPRKNSDENRRDEEIGPRLVSQLEKLDPRLAQLRCQAWENIGKRNPSTLRLAAHAIREMFSEVVRTLAPDEAVKGSMIWRNREDMELAKPTRLMRFEFLLGSHPEKLAAVKQFAKSLEKAHKFAHTFPEDPELVRAYLAEVETCVYLLLVYTGAGKR